MSKLIFISFISVFSAAAGAQMPVITSQPSNCHAIAGSSCGFTVVASGSMLTYQWYHGASGDTSVKSSSLGYNAPTHTVSRITSSNEPVRWVRVSNASGHVDSIAVQALVEAQTTKIEPALTWVTPAKVSAGTVLSSTQLNATASVPGTFAYTPAVGALLSAGTETLRAVFTPADGKTYSTGSVSVLMAVSGTVSVTTASTYNGPSYSHIVIVMEENHDYGQIIGNKTNAPYINTLVAGGANFTAYNSITHPSQPNYIAVYSGSTMGVADDDNHSLTGQTLDTILTSSGHTFVGYVEAGSPRKHNPWESFPEGLTVEHDMTSFPSTASGFEGLPRSPGLCLTSTTICMTARSLREILG
jgi:hypothetical protein